MYEIVFGYLPSSPLSNGWKLAYRDAEAEPSFASPSEVPGAYGLSMDVKQKYAIDFDLPQRTQLANQLELAIKYDADAMFYIKVNVTSRDGSQRDYGWINIRLGNAPSRQHKDYLQRNF